jgi:RNA polymerase sigma factor (sigma-70 family)
MVNFRGSSEQSFVAYLREICFHMTIDFLRRQEPNIGLEKVQYCISVQDTNNRMDHHDLTRIIGIISEELPKRHRYLFKLMYEEDLPSSEISDIMGINLNALHQLKFRMMKNIVRIAERKQLYYDLKTFVHQQPLIMFGLNEIESVI